MTEIWHRITPRFSIGWAWGLNGPGKEGFVGIAPFTYYWTPRKRHHKVYIHLLFLRVVLAWHRRKHENKPSPQAAPPMA